MPVYEGQVKVRWVTTISNIQAPTVAEINAGTDLSPFVTKDGVRVPTNQNMVDTGDINTVFDSQEPGSWGGPLGLTLKRTAADTAWNLFAHSLTGFVVISWDNWTNGTVSAGDKVQVYPAKSHHPVMTPPAANEVQRFTVELGVTAEPALKAVVA
jgi:hypothetical protein